MRSELRLVITHGNGPMVGKILMRRALTRTTIPPMNMDVCVAHSRGGIAYMLMQGLENALRECGNARRVVCLLTRFEVDAHDPAFTRPPKPVGFFYDADEARDLEHTLGWTMREDAGCGYRYAVPSPRPRRIVDIALIDTVARSGAAVIAHLDDAERALRGDAGTRIVAAEQHA